ncbi:MAG: hypothetical protein FJY53_04815 [Betaproteobacteria bacterium]|nr:hypothetical protein [Betaproteobacteria bacterium]
MCSWVSEDKKSGIVIRHSKITNKVRDGKRKLKDYPSLYVSLGEIEMSKEFFKLRQEAHWEKEQKRLGDF